MNKLKTIFIGSGEFSIPILKKILEIDFLDLVAVVTQPNKPVGRKQVLTPTPLGIYLEEIGIKALKPEKISTQSLADYKPDIILVASYGQIIPLEILRILLVLIAIIIVISY